MRVSFGNGRNKMEITCCQRGCCINDAAQNRILGAIQFGTQLQVIVARRILVLSLAEDNTEMLTIRCLEEEESCWRSLARLESVVIAKTL